MRDVHALLVALGLVWIGGCVIVLSANVCAALTAIAESIRGIEVLHEVYVEDRDGDEWKGERDG